MVLRQKFASNLFRFIALANNLLRCSRLCKNNLFHNVSVLSPKIIIIIIWSVPNRYHDHTRPLVVESPHPPPPLLGVSEPEMLISFYCFVWGGGSGSSQTLSKSLEQRRWSGSLPVRLSIMSPPIQPYHSTGIFNEKGGTSAQKGIWVEGAD